MIRSLEKLGELLGEYSDPWNLFERRTRICKPGNNLNQKGNVSLNLLSSTDLGSSPDNWLRPTSSEIKATLTDSSRNFPERLLFRRCKIESLVLKFSKHRGIEPLKLLLDKTRTSRESSSQIV
ncbi:hypothetical protein BRARA_A02060, partial [Brassica rapa]